jgi:hypothetical protein
MRMYHFLYKGAEVKLDTVVPLGLELPFHIFPRHENRTHSFVKLQTIVTD